MALNIQTVLCKYQQHKSFIFYIIVSCGVLWLYIEDVKYDLFDWTFSLLLNLYDKEKKSSFFHEHLKKLTSSKHPQEV